MAYFRKRARKKARSGKRGNATVNRYMSAISHVLTMAANEWEWLDRNPARRVRRYEEPTGRQCVLTREQAATLLGAAKEERERTGKPMDLIVGLAVATGARKGELRHILRRNVLFGEGFARIVLEKTKSGKPRTLRVEAPAVLDLLRAYHDKPLGDKRSPYLLAGRRSREPMEWEREWRRLRARAGMRGVWFHDLRHACASFMALSGAQLPDITGQLGHSSARHTERYVHLICSHAEEAAARMQRMAFGSA